MLQLSRLEWLFIDGNTLSGMPMDILFSFLRLKDLTMSYNPISGDAAAFSVAAFSIVVFSSAASAAACLGTRLLPPLLHPSLLQPPLFSPVLSPLQPSLL